MKMERAYARVALAACLLAGASAALLYLDCRAASAHQRALLLDRADTTLNALTAGLRAHGRMGRYRHERLAFIFEELADTPDVVGAALLGGDGKLIAGGGADLSKTPGGDQSDAWYSGGLRVEREIDLVAGGHGAGGRWRGGEGNGWKPIPDGPYWVALALDSAAMDHEISRSEVRALMTFGVALLAILSGAAVWANRIRQRQLQSALALAQERAARQEQLTQLGAGLAHETKNPLGIVRGLAQLIGDAEGDPQADCVRAAQIVDEVDRTVGQINAFLNLARPVAPVFDDIPLAELADSIATLLADEARQYQIDLVAAVPDITVRGDAGQLRRLLLNVVLNAFRACDGGGKVVIEAGLHGDKVWLEIRDDGCGIEAEDLPRVTEPYFNRFPSGTGLGLSIAAGIASAHGWVLTIDSPNAAGTTIRLTGFQMGRPKT